MADLISREAALDAINGIRTIHSNMEQVAMKALCWASIKTIQPVDAALVVHARWIDIPDKPEWDQKMCSACGDYFCCQNKFCPSCGAKMDGERRDGNAAD